MKLLIFYLTDNSRHFTFPHFIDMLNKSQKKTEWKLLILTHTNDNDFYIENLKNYDIQYDVNNVEPHNNYLRKVLFAAEYAEINQIPYVMKCDNDIFLKAQTLDFMIDNLYLLDEGKHLTIGPVLTSGIPGIEYFKEQFLDIEAQSKLDNLFLNTVFYDRDNANYVFLNQFTINAEKWEKNKFFDSIKSMNHHYKGLHPIRVNEESLDFLNRYIIQNKERFMKDYELEIIYNDNSPYLCNSIFCIKTNIYKEILNDSSLYVDCFDEVPLNKYAWKNNLNHLFVKNGYAIHMYYNWNHNHIYHEQLFCQNFFHN
jgi:hypothetical protein